MGEGPPAPARCLRSSSSSTTSTTGNGLAASARPNVALLRGAGLTCACSAPAAPTGAAGRSLPRPRLPAPGGPRAQFHRIIRSQGYAFAHAERKAVRAGVSGRDVVRTWRSPSDCRPGRGMPRAMGPCLGTYHIHPENITRPSGSPARPLNRPGPGLMGPAHVYRHYAVVQKCPSGERPGSASPRSASARAWSPYRMAFPRHSCRGRGAFGSGRRTRAPAHRPEHRGARRRRRLPRARAAPPSEDSPPDRTARPGAGGTFSGCSSSTGSRGEGPGHRPAGDAAQRAPTASTAVFPRDASPGARLRRDAAPTSGAGCSPDPAVRLPRRRRPGPRPVRRTSTSTPPPSRSRACRAWRSLRHGVVPVIARSPHSATAQFAGIPAASAGRDTRQARPRTIDYWLEDDARRRASACRYRGVGAVRHPPLRGGAHPTGAAIAHGARPTRVRARGRRGSPGTAVPPAALALVSSVSHTRGGNQGSLQGRTQGRRSRPCVRRVCVNKSPCAQPGKAHNPGDRPRPLPGAPGERGFPMCGHHPPAAGGNGKIAPLGN